MQIAPFKIERYFARYEFSVDYLLCSSDCEAMTIADLLKLEPNAQEGFHQHWLGYTESSGSPSLRQEISRLYTTIEPEQVLVHAGAEEAIFLFMHGVLQAGDHVIVHWPCYQSLLEVAGSIGCEVTLWEARKVDGWAPDVAVLPELIHPNTKAIVVNAPHNPTGFLFSHKAYLALHEVANQHGVILFSDEVYRESEYDAADRLPAGCDVGETAVSLGVMSKSYGLPGLRIGWIATRNAEVYHKMAMLKDYTTICNSAPSEFLTELALRHRETILQRNLQIITSNLNLLDQFFARHADRFVWQRPQAGPIAFPRLIDGDIEQFCEGLVQKANVLLLPGSVYNYPGNHFRIGFGRRNLPEAIGRVNQFLQYEWL